MSSWCCSGGLVHNVDLLESDFIMRALTLIMSVHYWVNIFIALLKDDGHFR